MMERDRIKSAVSAVGAALILALIFSPLSPATGRALPAQDSQNKISAKDKRLVSEFEARAKAYVKQREKLEGKLPKLSKDSTPEQIEAHKKALQDAVRKARRGARQGDIFRPGVADYIRAVLRKEFQGKDGEELRKTYLLESEAKGVSLVVNNPYPESQGLMEMPPTLLLKLPQLPKQLRYRFVGRQMLLVDRENGLILDYMLDAIP